jgi:hypothetical protein
LPGLFYVTRHFLGSRTLKVRRVWLEMQWLVFFSIWSAFFAVNGLASSDFTDYSTEDVFVPTQCDSIAKLGDHLLIEYTVAFANGSTAASQKAPSQLYHVLLDKSVSMSY